MEYYSISRRQFIVNQAEKGNDVIWRYLMRLT